MTRSLIARRGFFAALLAGTSVLLASCGGSGGDGGSDATTGGSGGGETLTIGEQEWALDPSSPSVAKGGSVTIHVTNDGAFGHALEIEGNGVEEETETIAAGDSADLTVDLKPGEYTFYCAVPGHREAGMEGTLTVK